MQALRRLLVVGALTAALGSPAHADEPADRGYRFAPPAGLTYNESLSRQLADDLANARHYDGLKTSLGAEAYVTDGLAFYVLWIYATEPAADTALAVRRTFDQLRQAPVDTTSKVHSAELLSWREDVGADLAVGELQWRHISNETVTRVHTRMYATERREPRELRAECVMRATDVERLRPLCDAAIAALELTETRRASLGAVPSAGSLRLSDAADDDRDMLLVVEDGIDAGTTAAPPSLRTPTDGAVLYEQPARPGADSDSTSSSTFLYVGGAILLIVAVYVLTRRSGSEGPTRD